MKCSGYFETSVQIPTQPGSSLDVLRRATVPASLPQRVVVQIKKLLEDAIRSVQVGTKYTMWKHHVIGVKKNDGGGREKDIKSSVFQ